MNYSRFSRDPYIRYAFLFGAILAIAACDTLGGPPPARIEPPMKITKSEVAPSSIEITKENAGSKRDRLTSANGPVPPTGRATSEPMHASEAPKLTGDPISINFEGIRLPAFINTVFGELLKVTFEIDNGVMQKDIMVTLRTAEPLKPDQFYNVVTEVLANYGVSVVYTNNVYRIVDSTSVKKPIPKIIRSRAGGSVPTDMRPLFFFQQLNNVPTTTMSIWIDLVLKDRVQVVPLPYANGLLLLGKSEDVAAATEIIQTLDQPYLAGSRSLKISPAFWSAQKLTAQLIDILTAEGYSVGMGGANSSGIKLIPIEALNVIIAFGTGEEALQHVLQWASDLDQPGQTVSSQGAFYHQVYNAKAKDLAEIVKGLVETAIVAPAASNNQQQTTTAPSTVSSKQRIMVDEARNGIIFVGSAEEYAQFRSLMQQMDRAPLQVMIEATIAEVTLKEGESLGMVFNFDNGVADALNRSSVKVDGSGVFVNLIRDHGTLISQINALADYNRLQVLSSPRLVTSSGKAAAISVGTQVPIITSQESTPNGQVAGTSSILQSIQYRNTGIILNINPTINSNRRVELTVSQEVSDAQQNNVSGVQSPVIINRSLQTTLSLDDGETALLGGMISENYSKGNGGIPYLKDIPILGNLFKSQSSSVNRTELIILLTPYIIDSADTARQVRDSFRSKLGEWAAPTPASDAAPAPPAN